MKYLRLIWIPILLGLTHNVSGQTEYMINGGFEQWDNDDNNDGIADDYYDHSIEYAVGWHNLINTCDVVHPNYDMISGTPRTGVACGRFGAPQNGMAEFCYGTTQPLTAGDTYRVSFWVRKDYSTGADKQIGVVIAPTVPNVQLSPYSSSIQPLITYVPTGTQYVQVSACFTAQSSGTHYLTFGPFGGVSTPESNIYLIDDVSVTSIDPATQLPVAGLTIPTTAYCVGDAISVDGSSTTNEEGYRWEIVRTSPGGGVRYNSGDQTGQAGTLDVSAVIGTVLPGECYRVSLTALGSCTDRTYVDFCFVNPRVDILHEGTAVCENTPVELTATGGNGWVYTWSNGQSGVGLKTVTVFPTLGNANYSVTVTTPEGCTFTQSLTLVVHTANNLAPWMDGINGTGEYTYYVQAGETVNFNVPTGNDNSNELVNLLQVDQVEGNLSFPNNGSTNPTMQYYWETPAFNSGIYNFDIAITDNNACNSMSATYTFTIIVVCDHCPICINYEDRTPAGIPLPSETKSGKCITAGLSQPVATGTMDVAFRAGHEIVLGDHFTAGPGFTGEIDPTVCIDDCEDCCEEWNGFTYDELPNPFYMNFSDGDPTTDFIQVTDMYHPFCAFNAKGFEFAITNRFGNLMNIGPVRYMYSYCCPLESPAPENPIPHSSIWWDGYIYDGSGSIARPIDGVYSYKLILFGCNGQTIEKEGSIQMFGSVVSMAQASGENSGNLASASLSERDSSLLATTKAERERLERAINLYPNPTTGQVTVSGVETEEVMYQLFDDKGNMLTRKEPLLMGEFSLEDYPPGTYYVWIYANNTYISKKVVKI